MVQASSSAGRAAFFQSAFDLQMGVSAFGGIDMSVPALAGRRCNFFDGHIFGKFFQDRTGQGPHASCRDPLHTWPPLAGQVSEALDLYDADGLATSEVQIDLAVACGKLGADHTMALQRVPEPRIQMPKAKFYSQISSRFLLIWRFFHGVSISKRTKKPGF